MAQVGAVVDSYIHFCIEINDDADDDHDDDGDDDNFEHLWKQFNARLGERLMAKIESASPPLRANCRSPELT